MQAAIFELIYEWVDITIANRQAADKNCSRESTTFDGLHVHKYSINGALANTDDGFHTWRMAPVVKALA